MLSRLRHRASGLKVVQGPDLFDFYVGAGQACASVRILSDPFMSPLRGKISQFKSFDDLI